MARTRRASQTPARTLSKLSEAARKMIADTRSVAMSRALSAGKATLAGAAIARTGTVNAVTRLEHAFAQRVARTVGKLGVPTSKEVRALSRQVAQLQASVERLRRSRARA
jgi:hypothetical protein